MFWSLIFICSLNIEYNKLEVFPSESTLKGTLFIKNFYNKKIESKIIIRVLDLKNDTIFKAVEIIKIPEEGKKFDFHINIHSKDPLYLMKLETELNYEKKSFKKIEYLVRHLKLIDFYTNLYNIRGDVLTEQFPVYVKVFLERDKTPIKDARIYLYLNNIKILEGKTDKKGEFFSYVKLEEGGELLLKIKKGKEELFNRFYVVKRSYYDIYVETDKPIYSPGQNVHIRAMLLKFPEFKPVKNEKLIIKVLDPRRNTIIKDTIETNDFGICYKKFKLAEDIITGKYTIIIRYLGKEFFGGLGYFKVDKYEVPKFDFSVYFDKEYYVEGEEIKGNIVSLYTYGEPVINGEVNIKAGSNIDIKGKTDEKGEFTFSFPIEKWYSKLYIVVKDKSGFVRKREIAIPFINIDIVPHGGAFFNNTKNKFYIILSTTDNIPLSKKLLVRVLGKEFELETDSNGIGLGEVFVETKDKTIKFKIIDKSGIFKRELYSDIKTYPVVLKLEKRMYRQGERMILKTEIFRPDVDILTIELSQRSYVFTHKVVKIEHGQVESIDTIIVPDNLKGIANIKVSVLSEDGILFFDRKFVYIEPKEDLKLYVIPNKEKYEPGERGSIKVIVRKGNKRVKACLGISIVDSMLFLLSKTRRINEEMYFKCSGLFKKFWNVSNRLYNKNIELSDVIDAKREVIADLIFSYNEKNMYIIQRPVFRKLRYKKPRFVNYLEKFNDRIAKKMKEKANKIKRFIIENKNIPDSVFMDPFGNMCDYYFTNRKLVLFSKGMDGKPYTRDDINISVELSEKYIKKYFEKKGTNTVIGKVIDSVTKEGLPFAVVRILRTPYTTYTNEKGNYLFKNICPGTYDIEVMYTGYKAVRKKVIIKESKVCTVNFAMRSVTTIVEPLEVRTEGSRSQITEFFKEVEVFGKTMEDIPIPETELRKYFPESFAFIPFLMTNDSGEVSLNIDFPDNITLWKVKTGVITEDGSLDVKYLTIKVFKDFYVDFNIPEIMTEGDELFLPVNIHNNTDRDIKCNLKIRTSEHIKIIDDVLREILVKKKGVYTVYFKIKAFKSGEGKIRVYVWNKDFRDAVEKKVMIKAYCIREKTVISGVVKGNERRKIEFTLDPEKAINFELKIYKSGIPLADDAFKSLILKPIGCFEQTSSRLYPLILVWKILKRHGIKNKKLEDKIKEYIFLGYQRILKFETGVGGFSWYGNFPPDLLLTAYGLMQLKDLNEVYPVDKKVIERAIRWVYSKQEEDGSWTPDRKVFFFRFNIEDLRLLTTGYVLWALIEWGEEGDRVKKGLKFLKEHVKGIEDPYILSILLNCFVSYDPNMRIVKHIADKIIEKKIKNQKGVFWSSDGSSITFSKGRFFKIETTSLVLLGLMKSKILISDMFLGIKFLMNNKRGRGGWGTTQSTILALKAIDTWYQTGFENIEGYVEIIVNGKKLLKENIEKIQEDIYLLDLKPYLKKENNVSIYLRGKGFILYEIAGEYYMNWEEVKERQHPFLLNISYKKIKDNGNVYFKVICRLKNKSSFSTYMNMVEIGVPSYFYVINEEIRNNEFVREFEIRRDKIIIYGRYLKPGEEVRLFFNIYPKFKMNVKTFGSLVYEYYNPDNYSLSKPVSLTVP